MKPEIKTVLENLEFHEHKDKDKQGLFLRKLDVNDACGRAGITAYIDFRRTEKGRRTYTIEGVDGIFDADDDVDAIPVLLYFKQERDKILGIKPEEKAMAKKSTKTIPHEHKELILTGDQFINNAANLAKTLANVIDKTKMFKVISGKKYVYVDGWETLGAMMFCRSEVTDIQEYKNGYKAFVTIFDRDGQILSKGSAICTRDEKNWKDREEYAIYSMAQTRALGKAYRLGLSWIMSLAGFESVPAEEMSD